jgi:hypothetical protein
MMNVAQYWVSAALYEQVLQQAGGRYLVVLVGAIANSMRGSVGFLPNLESAIAA